MIFCVINGNGYEILLVFLVLKEFIGKFNRFRLKIIIMEGGRLS